MENCVIFKDMKIMRSMSRMTILRVTFRFRHALPLTTSPVMLPVVGLTEIISSGSVLNRYFKVSRQLSKNRSVSMLVKKPARSWL